jgi:hypothetical protein
MYSEMRFFTKHSKRFVYIGSFIDDTRRQSNYKYDILICIIYVCNISVYMIQNVLKRVGKLVSKYAKF